MFLPVKIKNSHPKITAEKIRRNYKQNLRDYWPATLIATPQWQEIILINGTFIFSIFTSLFWLHFGNRSQVRISPRLHS